MLPTKRELDNIQTESYCDRRLIGIIWQLIRDIEQLQSAVESLKKQGSETI